MVVGLSAAWHSSCLHAPAPLPLSPGHQIAVYLCSGLRARIEEARIATGVHGRFADGISCERNDCLDGGGPCRRLFERQENIVSGRDRKRGGEGKRVSGSVGLGGGRI